jgi:hypothetical protein
MDRAYSTNEKRNANMVLFGNPEGIRPLARLTRRFEDRILMGVREIGCLWLYMGVKHGL